MFGINDERHQIVRETFSEHDQAADSAVSILKRMNPFKIEMEFYNVFYSITLQRVIGTQQGSHFFSDFLRFRRLHFPDCVGKFFVLSDPEPVEPTLRSSLFQQKMIFLDDLFRQFFFRSIQHVVKRGKMIERFNDVVRSHSGVFFTENGMSFINIPGLIMSQLIALNPVGVVGNRNLRIMIQPAFEFRVLFLAQPFQNFAHDSFSLFILEIYFRIVDFQTCLSMKKRYRQRFAF